MYGIRCHGHLLCLQASIGLDCPIEVVNLKEVEDMAKVVSHHLLLIVLLICASSPGLVLP